MPNARVAPGAEEDAHMRLFATLIAGGALLTWNLGAVHHATAPRAARSQDDGGRQLAARVSYDCGRALLVRARRGESVDTALLELAAQQFRACLACATPQDADALIRNARQNLELTQTLLAQGHRPAAAPARAVATTTEPAPTPAGPEPLPAPREVPVMVGPDGVAYQPAAPATEKRQAVEKSIPDEEATKRRKALAPPVRERSTDRALPLPKVSPGEMLAPPLPDTTRTKADLGITALPVPAPQPSEGKMVGPDGVVYERDPGAGR